MEDLAIVMLVISVVVSIILLIIFINMAKDISSINEKVKSMTRMANDVHFIKERQDGELNFLSEERSIGEINFLIVNGYTEEAKRMLLRKVWYKKDNYSYIDLKHEYEHYFIKIGVAFPCEEDLAILKASNPIC